ncbi:39S ribosomal protein L2, mitochondrial [Anthonomus grandis grandis]|uniref:39S ribosomal protein L2, mitochondrial n=1 Tax=Anthonomus grandis grandis TaxID=2921223 RepID=UPI002166A981|nr:39S ribosomal protein L2, mitochondrial [Anthonomus grandis grandis]
MFSLNRLFQRLSIQEIVTVQQISIRTKTKYVTKPVIGHGISFRRKVNFPEEYTVKPVKYTNLAGRDPKTGRLVVHGIGGGIKHKYHWIDWIRTGPKEGPPQIEKVIKVMKDGCRTAHIALVAYGDKLKYILATENMKAGDLLKTSCHIPRIPVRANEGDAYPLGALPIGTQVHCVEKYPGVGGFLVHAAGTYATILRKAPNNHVVILTPSKKEFSLPEICMCTVGRVSNVEHGSTPIGSAQKNRELGNRPRSGWWHRKTGRFGRKLRKPPPTKTIKSNKKEPHEIVEFTPPRPFVKTIRAQFRY